MTPSRPLIGEEELEAAAEGHTVNTPGTVMDIDLALLQAGIDPHEALSLMKGLRAIRFSPDQPCSEDHKSGWVAGMLDGLLIGSRAAHEAWERRDRG